jgi:SH3-like domain-containing protein
MTKTGLLGHMGWVGMALVLLACPRGKDAPRDAAPAQAAAVDAGSSQPGVVAWPKVAMRATADEKAKVLTTVNYGERLTVLDKGDPFTRVRLSDGQDGFILSRFVVVGMAQDATLTQDQDLYARPDALSPVKKRERPGVLFLVTQDANGWRQVQLQDRTVAWVPRDKAVTDEHEVAVAMALYRGEALMAERKPEAAATAYQDALTAHSGARLAPLLGTRLAAFPRDAGTPVVDSGAATPVDAAVHTTDGGTP